MNLTVKQLLKLNGKDKIDIDGKKLNVIERGSWEQDGKYQLQEVVFTDGEKFYTSSIARSGSPFTEWYYEDWGDAEITEVKKEIVMVTKWVTV